MIQARYGWTDQQILDLPYARLMELAEVTSRKLVEEQRQRHRELAFLGWQFHASQPGVKPMRLGEWLEMLGLNEDRIEHEKITAHDAIQRAQRIVAMDTRRRKT